MPSLMLKLHLKEQSYRLQGTIIPPATVISRDLKLSSMRQVPDGGEAALESSRATGSTIGCFAIVSLQQAR